MLNIKEIALCTAVFLLPAIIALPLKSQLKQMNIDKEKKISPWVKPLDFFMGKNVLWIDSRSPKKYDGKHIPGAVNVSQYNWEEGLEALFLSEKFVEKPDVILAVYCDEGCHDSEAVAVRLRDALQSDRVYILKGGMDEWFESQK